MMRGQFFQRAGREKLERRIVFDTDGTRLPQDYLF